MRNILFSTLIACTCLYAQASKPVPTPSAQSPNGKSCRVSSTTELLQFGGEVYSCQGTMGTTGAYALLPGGSSGGATTPPTTLLYKGTGVMNGVTPATPNTDYLPPANPALTGTATYNGVAFGSLATQNNPTSGQITTGLGYTAQNAATANSNNAGIGACSTHFFITGTAAGGTQPCAQPNYTDLAGTNPAAAGAALGSSALQPPSSGSGLAFVNSASQTTGVATGSQIVTAIGGTPVTNATGTGGVSFGPYATTPTINGDGTLNGTSGALTVTKLNGVLPGTLFPLSATNTPLLGTPTIGGNPIGASRVTSLPSSCTAGATGPLSAVIFNTGGNDAVYVCDSTGHYSLPPGGSTTVLSGTQTYASGPGGSNQILTTLPFTGTVQQTQTAVNSQIPNIKAFGAYGDTIYAGTTPRCGITAGSTTLTCTTAAPFVPSDATAPAKAICIEKGVSSTQNLCTTIATYISATQVTLATPATVSVPSGIMIFGHDDTAAFQAAAATGVNFQIASNANYWVNGSVVFNEPILMSSIGVSGTVYCMSQTAQCFQWNYTASGQNLASNNFMSGAENVNFQGPDVINGGVGTSGGVLFGQSGSGGGAVGANLTQVVIEHFGIDFEIAEGSFYNHIKNSYLRFAGMAFYLPPVVALGGESIEFDGTVIQLSGASAADSSHCIDIEGDAEISFKSGSFIACGLTQNGTGTTQLIAMHHENQNSETTPDINLTASGNIVIDAPNAIIGLTGSSGEPTTFAAASAGLITIRDGYFLNETGASPNLISISGSGKGRVYGKNIISGGLGDYLGTPGGSDSYVEPTNIPVSTTVPYTALQTDGILYCNGGTAAISLQSAPYSNEEIFVRNLSTTQTCIVTGNSGNIGSAATYTLNPLTAAMFSWYPNSTTWQVQVGGAQFNPFTVVGSSGNLSVGGAAGNAITFTGTSTNFIQSGGALALQSNGNNTRCTITTLGVFECGSSNQFQVSAAGAISTPTITNSINAVASSATPAFNLSLGTYQTNTLTANVTSFTVTGITAGGRWCFDFAQNGTGGFTVSGAPASMHGFFTVGTTASKDSVQCFFSTDGTILKAESTGVINQ